MTGQQSWEGSLDARRNPCELSCLEASTETSRFGISSVPLPAHPKALIDFIHRCHQTGTVVPTLPGIDQALLMGWDRRGQEPFSSKQSNSP